MQNVGKTHEQRQGEAGGLRLLAQLIQVDAGVRAGAARPHMQMAGVVDVEILAAPMGNVVGVPCLLYVPTTHYAAPRRENVGGLLKKLPGRANWRHGGHPVSLKPAHAAADAVLAPVPAQEDDLWRAPPFSAPPSASNLKFMEHTW